MLINVITKKNLKTEEDYRKNYKVHNESKFSLHLKMKNNNQYLWEVNARKNTKLSHLKHFQRWALSEKFPNVGTAYNYGFFSLAL